MTNVKLTPDQLRAYARHVEAFAGRFDDVTRGALSKANGEYGAWGGSKDGQQFANGSKGYLAQVDWVRGVFDGQSQTLHGFADAINDTANSLDQMDNGDTSQPTSTAPPPSGNRSTQTPQRRNTPQKPNEPSPEPDRNNHHQNPNQHNQQHQNQNQNQTGNQNPSGTPSSSSGSGQAGNAIGGSSGQTPGSEAEQSAQSEAPTYQPISAPGGLGGSAGATTSSPLSPGTSHTVAPSTSPAASPPATGSAAPTGGGGQPGGSSGGAPGSSPTSGARPISPAAPARLATHVNKRATRSDAPKTAKPAAGLASPTGNPSLTPSAKRHSSPDGQRGNHSGQQTEPDATGAPSQEA